MNSENDATPVVALTADDDEFFRIALRSILTKQLGAREVIETGTFDDAIDKLALRRDVSIALFDLQMPGIDDPASLRLVRESFPDVRVVVVSSSQQRENILAALEAGAHGYLPKSLGPGDLARALGLVLEGTIFVPPSLAVLTPAGDASELASSSSEVAVISLTRRQRQVLELLVSGKSNKSIARAMGLGEGTVKIHVAALFRNLGVTNRAAAAAMGARLLVAEKPTNQPKRGEDG